MLLSPVAHSESYTITGCHFNPSPLLTWVRHPTLGDQLCEQDAEGPHVGLDGELSVQRGLWSGPLDGELCTCRRGVSGDSVSVCLQVHSHHLLHV